MEKYERKYKKALEYAKQELESCESQDCDGARQMIFRLFPELQKSEDERIREEIIEFFKKASGGFLDPTIRCETFGKWQAWVEKQGEQTDKIKPRFKIGDWVVNKIGMVNQISKDWGDGYTLDNHVYLSDSWATKHYRLWNIDDIKDGDVLVNGSNVFIFHFLNDTRLMGYCHVNIDDGRFYDDLGKNECFCLIDAVVTPATTEQRDLLFKKMEEAGYKLDGENKELKNGHIYS